MGLTSQKVVPFQFPPPSVRGCHTVHGLFIWAWEEGPEGCQGAAWASPPCPVQGPRQ